LALVNFTPSPNLNRAINPQFPDFQPKLLDTLIPGLQSKPMVSGKSNEYSKPKSPAIWISLKLSTETVSASSLDIPPSAAAHKKLPLPSVLRVRNLKNNKVIYVRVNDRGPHRRDRLIDLSEAAAREIGIIESGLGQVEIKLMKKASIQLKELITGKKVDIVQNLRTISSKNCK